MEERMKAMFKRKRLWKETEVAEFSGFSVKTLQKWRHMHQGPPYIKYGRSVRYDPEAVEQFFSEQTVTPEG